MFEIVLNVLLDFFKSDAQKTTQALREYFFDRLGIDDVAGILKKCPLCGGEARLTIEEIGSSDCPAVRCEKCTLSICGEESVEKVIKRWNTRIEWIDI